MAVYTMGDVSLSSSANSITMSNITNSSDIKVLVLELSLRSDRANVYSYVGLRFNGDAASNYAALTANATKSSSVNVTATLTDPSTSSGNISIPGGSGVANTFCGYRFYIYGYNNPSQFKFFYGQGGHDQNTSGGQFTQCAGVWKSTATINSITAVSLDANFVANSRMSLYGMGIA